MKEQICESVEDLKNLVEDSTASMASIALKIVSDNWETLIECQNEVKTRLLERIKKEAYRTETLISHLKLLNLLG